MGYDMYFRGKSYGDGDEFYFRLNIFGMSRYRSYMTERGMVFDAPEHPPFPEVEAYAVTHDDVERVECPEYFQDDAPPGAETTEKVRRYLAALDDVLAWHGPEIPGIPVHKFGSNDGWIVLPAECAAAVSAARQYPPPEGAGDYWDEWIDYLDRASRADGFEVH